MIAAASQPDDEYGAIYKEPLPYLHHFNTELEEAGLEPLFVETEQLNAEGYELTRPLDFRSWPEVPSKQPYYLASDTPGIPESRIRVVGEHFGEFLHECFERVDLPIASDNVAEIFRQASTERPYRWKVTLRTHSFEFCTCPSAKLKIIASGENAQLLHEDCGRIRKSKVEGDMGEHVANLSLGMADDEYNGYYPTIPGNDVAHFREGAKGMEAHRGGDALMGSYGLDNQNRVIEDRQEVRGGTEIRGGRAEHRKKTKDLIAWDSGTDAHLARLKADKEQKRKDKNREFIERKLNLAPRDMMDL